MMTQAELIEALGGHRELADHLAPLFQSGSGRQRQAHDRVRKWKEADHIPPAWRFHVRAVAIKAGFKLSELPAEMLLPEEAEQTEGDAAA